RCATQVIGGDVLEFRQQVLVNDPLILLPSALLLLGVAFDVLFAQFGKCCRLPRPLLLFAGICTMMRFMQCVLRLLACLSQRQHRITSQRVTPQLTPAPIEDAETLVTARRDADAETLQVLVKVIELALWIG